MYKGFLHGIITESSYAALTAQFNQSVYSSSEEDEQVMLFISVQGQSDVSFQLQLQTEAGSASCKPCDYQYIHGIITMALLIFSTANDFDSTIQLVPIQAPFANVLVSHTIQIENDNIAEPTETFSVVLSSNDDRISVPIQTSTAEVNITDTDSKPSDDHIIIILTISLQL